MRNTNHVVSRGLLGLVALAALGIAASARADSPALSFSTDGGYINGFTGTLGWQFAVNTDVTLTAFGFYNNGGPIATSHEVGLWDLSGNLLASGTVGPSGTGTTVGFFDYSPTTSYLLKAGTSYVIGTNLTADDFFYYAPSSVTTDPRLSYVQEQYDVNGTSSLSFPQTSDFLANGYGYFGPNFLVASGNTGGGGNNGGDPVPEPSEWAAMGVLGLGLAGLVVRKRRLRG